MLSPSAVVVGGIFTELKNLLETMEEIWKPLPNSDLYQVSNLGNVRSRRGANGLLLKCGWRLCKQSPYPKGYRSATIDNKLQLVHRLVLTAFVGPCPDGMEACHRNDVHADNRLDNLYWGTPSQNSIDKIYNGRQAGQKLTIDEAVSIKCYLKYHGWTPESAARLCSCYPVGRKTMYDLWRGKTWAWL